MLTWARLLSVQRRRVNPSRTGDPQPWNAPFLINRREERCEDRLAYFLRRLSRELVRIARRDKGRGDTCRRENFAKSCGDFPAIPRASSALKVGTRPVILFAGDGARLREFRLLQMSVHEIACRRDYRCRESHGLSPCLPNPWRQVRILGTRWIHNRKCRSTSPRFAHTTASARCYAASFDRIWAVLRNSRPSRRAKWCDLANPLHLDERECVWCHQIHYPNSGEITHRAL